MDLLLLVVDVGTGRRSASGGWGGCLPLRNTRTLKLLLLVGDDLVLW